MTALKKDGLIKMNEEDLAKAQLNLEERKQDVSFLQGSQRKENDSIFSKHLEAEKLLEHIEKLLMGYQYDTEEETYTPVLKTVYTNGQAYQVEQGALLDPNYIRMSITYLKSFLNSNVFLSYLESMEQINAIMWDVNIKLTRLLHPLKNLYDPKTIEMTYAIIETSIYFAINRAYKKISLDAMTKTSYSMEHIGGMAAKATEEQKKQFKIFGF